MTNKETAQIPSDLQYEYDRASYDYGPAFWGSDVRYYIARIGRAESLLRAAEENLSEGWDYSAWLDCVREALRK